MAQYGIIEPSVYSNDPTAFPETIGLYRLPLRYMSKASP
jgi:hypothetical protein